jgi:hypothetical protein
LACEPIRNALAVIALTACVPDAPARYVQHAPTLAALRLRLPVGAHATYDVVVDRWVVATPTAYAITDAAPPAGVASPDALAHVIGMRVVARESLSDGFMATLVEHAAAPQRVTIVVRQLGNQWLRCVGDVDLCKSLKRG